MNVPTNFLGFLRLKGSCKADPRHKDSTSDRVRPVGSPDSQGLRAKAMYKTPSISTQADTHPFFVQKP